MNQMNEYICTTPLWWPHGHDTPIFLNIANCTDISIQLQMHTTSMMYNGMTAGASQLPLVSEEHTQNIQ